MFRLLICIFISFIALFGLEAESKIKISDLVTSINLFKNSLFVSTNAGKIEVFNIQNKKKIHTIKLPKIKDYFDNLIAPKIFQTHTLDGNNILILSQKADGGAEIWLYNLAAKKLKNIDVKKSGIINRAYFVDKNSIALGFLSNEIGLFDINKNEFKWLVSPSQAVFSDMIVDSNFIFSTTEGGIIYMIDIKTGAIKKEFSGANFDNIYKLAQAKDILITAGRDKNCGIYNIANGSFQRIQTEFLAYMVGISPDSKFGAVSFNENNDILVFDTQNLAKIAFLKGGDSLPNGIIFSSNNIIASFDSNIILFWRLEK